MPVLALRCLASYFNNALLSHSRVWLCYGDMLLFAFSVLLAQIMRLDWYLVLRIGSIFNVNCLLGIASCNMGEDRIISPPMKMYVFIAFKKNAVQQSKAFSNNILVLFWMLTSIYFSHRNKIIPNREKIISTLMLIFNCVCFFAGQQPAVICCRFRRLTGLLSNSIPLFLANPSNSSRYDGLLAWTLIFRFQ